MGDLLELIADLCLGTRARILLALATYGFLILLLGFHSLHEEPLLQLAVLVLPVIAIVACASWRQKRLRKKDQAEP